MSESAAKSVLNSKFEILKMRRSSDTDRLVFVYCAFGLLMGVLQIALN